MINERIEALVKLRALYVEARRNRVADNLKFGCPSGNERRLSEIQDAILAIDHAIRDEMQLSEANGSAKQAAFDWPASQANENEPGDAAQDREDEVECSSEPRWHSYAEWLSGEPCRAAG